MFHMNSVLIALFDWLLGQKGFIFVKMMKKLFFRIHMGHEAETWHTCL